MLAKLTWLNSGRVTKTLKEGDSVVKSHSANLLSARLSRNAAAVSVAALLFVSLPLSQFAVAQVQVVESQPTVRANDRNPRPISPQINSPQTNTAQTTYPQADNNIRPALPITEVTPSTTNSGGTTGDLYFQFQVMQQEVSELRGAVEELLNEVKKLKQQRLDDYVELDNRISSLGGSGVGGQRMAVSPDANSSPLAPNTSSPVVAASGDERTNYQNAIQLLLDKKDYDGAIAAFNAYLARFPGGAYEGNALYWLGQIYVIQQKYPQAIQSYSALINKLPNHDKQWEAKFSLGKVYFTTGDHAKAKELIKEVAESNSDVARLARNFLDDNLSS